MPPSQVTEHPKITQVLLHGTFKRPTHHRIHQQLSVQPKDHHQSPYHRSTNRLDSHDTSLFPVYDRHRRTYRTDPIRPYHHHHEHPSPPCRRPRRRALRLPSQRRRSAPPLFQQQHLGAGRLECSLPPRPEHGHYVSFPHLSSILLRRSPPVANPSCLQLCSRRPGAPWLAPGCRRGH